MPATLEDLAAVREVIDDSIAVLNWCGGSDSGLVDFDNQQDLVMPLALADAYRRALDQAQEHFELALLTLRGDNRGFPLQSVLAVLQLAAWTGDLRDFKLLALEYAGRSEVMKVASRGRTGGGVLQRFIFGRFLRTLDAALDSLGDIPGVAAIGELKTFVENVVTR